MMSHHIVVRYVCHTRISRYGSVSQNMIVMRDGLWPWRLWVRWSMSNIFYVAADDPEG